MLIALHDRIADGRDVSWIWDVDFERLAPQIESVICCGTRAAEMAMRLKYAGVALDRIDVRTDMDEALDRLAGADGSSYLLATYTAMLDLRGRLEQRGLVLPFWQEAA
jgi:UDP-N-acetylmuramyl tripeptide synthase